MSRYMDADKVCELLKNQADSIYPNTVKCGMCVTQKDVEQKTAILELIDFLYNSSTADAKEELLELVTLDRDTAYEEMNRLKAENAALKARLIKAVELPCKFGSTVYVLMQRNATIEVAKGTFRNIRRYEDDVWWVEFSDLWIDKKLEDFGKTVFLDESEAQAKLDEMKGGTRNE